MKVMRKPTFFVIGAPKCGTTALCNYLSHHPEVFFSVPKEPMFWNTEDILLRRQTRVTTIDAYLRLFARARDHHMAIGEGSACYLSSEHAVSRIIEFNPDARFIVMLRNPVEMAYAWHRELKFNFYEDIEDFEEAWKAQDTRRCGKCIPDACRAPRLLQYGEMGKYSTQIERCLSVVDAARLMVILFDDFAARTRNVYGEALRFLGLPEDGRTEFPRVRESQAHRSKLIARMMLQPPAIIAAPVAWIRRAAERNERSLAAIARRWLSVKQSRAPLRPDFEDELRRYFQPDVQRLASLIGRDLSYWTTGYASIAR